MKTSIVRTRCGLYDLYLTDPVHTVFHHFVHRCTSTVGKLRKNLLFLYIRYPVKQDIIISKGTELRRIPSDRLVYISAEGNYENVVTPDNRKAIVSFQLGQLEDLIGNQLGDAGGNFIRLGRGLIINMDYLYQIDITKQRLVLSDCQGCYHELSASKEVLTKLKAYLDATMNHE